MKKNVFLLVCLAMTFSAFTQNETKVVLNEIQVSPPQFTGVENAAKLLQTDNSKAIQNYLIKNITFPEKSVLFYDEGIEVIQFVVTAEGEVKDFDVINSVSKEIDNEVINALKATSGMWKPGSNNGNPTSMRTEVDLIFNIHESDINTIMQKFQERAQKHFTVASKNLFNKKVRKALRQFDEGINYMPHDKSLLVMRGMCKYELGNKEGALKDWERVNSLGGIYDSEGNSILYTQEISELKGYAELINVLEEHR